MSGKGQLVIPKAMRTAIGAKDGGLVLVAREGNCIVLAKPAELAKASRGSLKGLWGKTGRDVHRYLDHERTSWR